MILNACFKNVALEILSGTCLVGIICLEEKAALCNRRMVESKPAQCVYPLWYTGTSESRICPIQRYSFASYIHKLSLVLCDIRI